MQDLLDKLEPHIQKRIVALQKLQRLEALRNSFQYDPRRSLEYHEEAALIGQVIEGIIRSSLPDEKSRQKARDVAESRMAAFQPE